MTTEQMIEELYKVAGQHKNNVVGVGELNIHAHAMCTDVASRLKELYEQTKLATDTNVGNKWIQCSERLPSENGKYLATGIKVSEKLTDKQKQVILEMCENDMKIVDVAMALSLSTSTVQGHLNQIHTKTGMNPRCFYDLVELMDMVREG